MCRVFGWSWAEYEETPQAVIDMALREWPELIERAFVGGGCAWRD